MQSLGHANVQVLVALNFYLPAVLDVWILCVCSVAQLLAFPVVPGGTQQQGRSVKVADSLTEINLRL